MPELQGQSILVTGATTGIGEAFTKLALESGASVLAVGRRPEAVQALQEEVSSERLIGAVVDVRVPEQVRAAVDKAVQAFGGLTGAFNNAGFVGAFTPLHSQPDADFDEIIRTNVYGSFNVLKASIQAILDTGKGGSVVSTSSTCGHRGMGNIGAYVASKHAIEGLTRSAALEHAETGVRVNCVAPGFTDTPMMRQTQVAINPDDPESVKDAIVANIPMKRYADPREIAGAVAWLMSDESSFVTGQVIDVDGGGSTKF